MTGGPAIELGLPRLVNGEWQAAAVIHFAEGPARIAVTVPSETVARYIARLGSWVAVREISSLGTGWADIERAIAGRERATAIVEAATTGDVSAQATIREIRQRAAAGEAAAVEAEAWVVAAEAEVRERAGCIDLRGRVSTAESDPHLLPAPWAVTAPRGVLMTPRDREHLAVATYLRQLRHGVRLTTTRYP